jgi:hypothetical protein
MCGFRHGVDDFLDFCCDDGRLDVAGTVGVGCAATVMTPAGWWLCHGASHKLSISIPFLGPFSGSRMHWTTLLAAILVGSSAFRFLFFFCSANSTKACAHGDVLRRRDHFQSRQ